MRLVAITFSRYKRFADPRESRLNLDGKIIAIVGPNEAGKTSVLDGLASLNDELEIPAEEVTRGEAEPSQPMITARFWLEADDLAEIADLVSVPANHQWFLVQKYRPGGLVPALVNPIKRDLTRRHRAAADLQKLRKSPWLEPYLVAETGPLAAENFDGVMADLAGDDEKLGDAALVSELAENLDANRGESAPAYVEQVVENLRWVATDEGTHPNDQALARLLERRPEFLEFDDSARDLQYEYNLDPSAPAPSQAFYNLAGAAELDLDAYAAAVQRGATGDVAHMLEEANKELVSEFAAWTQSGVRPRIHKGDGLVLHVHVESEGGGYMKFNERSQGLKTFVALVAMMATRERDVPPVLIVDEAETHLHYDAQADLVRVFARQDTASQVIYTTHSAGCLPEDLGSGVRIIDPIRPTNHSRVRNKFWTDRPDEPGFSPLLLGMGASTLAFFPTRDAVVCEGPTEMVLLGTLLREATGLSELGYQIAPGGSSARPTRIGGLALEAPSVAWFVDGDQGGRDLRQKYVDQGVPQRQIVAAGGSGSGLVIEDFVDADIYLTAVNEELHRKQAAGPMPASALSSKNRPGSVKKWCLAEGLEEPSKVEVAHHVVLQQKEKLRAVIDTDRRDKLVAVHQRIAGVLDGNKKG